VTGLQQLLTCMQQALRANSRVTGSMVLRHCCTQRRVAAYLVIPQHTLSTSMPNPAVCCCPAAVLHLRSLTAALAHVQAGTGDVRRMLAACTFRPRLPGTYGTF
jgi:hypothetical protein